jgi:hypothetical protein
MGLPGLIPLLPAARYRLYSRITPAGPTRCYLPVAAGQVLEMGIVTRYRIVSGNARVSPNTVKIQRLAKTGVHFAQSPVGQF